MATQIRAWLALVLACLAAACASPVPADPTATPEAAAAPATAVLTPTGIAADDLPFTEAEVARISVESARAALDGGLAILVDVRDAGAYGRSHAAGALSIQLGEIESGAAGLDLDKERWIITYCT
jgi:hypothetical protein